MSASARDGCVVLLVLLITDRALTDCGSLRAADKSRSTRAQNGKGHTTRSRLGLFYLGSRSMAIRYLPRYLDHFYVIHPRTGQVRQN